MPPLVNEDSRFPRCRGTGMGDHVLQIQGVAPCCQMLKIWRKQEGQGTFVFGRHKGPRNVCLRCGQCAVDPNKIPSKVGSLWAIHWRSPTSALADALKRAEHKCGPASRQQRAMCDVPRQCFLSQRRLASFVLRRTHRASCASCACSI